MGRLKMSHNLVLAKVMICLAPLGLTEKCFAECQHEKIPTRTSSIAPYQSLICLCAHLTYGRATLEDVENILGTPSSSYQIGRREYARYSQYGLDIVSNEKGCIIGVRSIAFVPSASLSEQTKKDMKD